MKPPKRYIVIVKCGKEHETVLSYYGIQWYSGRKASILYVYVKNGNCQTFTEKPVFITDIRYYWFNNLSFEQSNCEVINKREITREQLLMLYASACDEWKDKIKVRYFPRVDLLLDRVELTLEEVDEMFKAATNEQLILLSEVFPKVIELDNINTGTCLLLSSEIKNPSFNYDASFDVIFWDVPCYFDGNGKFVRSRDMWYTFHQNNKFLRIRKSTSYEISKYIKSIIKY
jgi:hypothetical protein